MQIAVTALSSGGIAYFVSDVSSHRDCIWAINKTSYNCMGTHPYWQGTCDGCSGGSPEYGNYPPCWDCAVDLGIICEDSACYFEDAYHRKHCPSDFKCKKPDLLSRCESESRCGSYNDVTISCDGTTDTRTTAQKEAGCCPAALVSSPPPPVCVSECVPDCDLKIESFYGSSTTINPKSGGTINFSGGISSSKPVTWTVIVAGKTFNGTGNSVFVSWNGRNSAGKVVDPGSYTATLSASATDDPSCSNSKTIPFTVKENDGCSLSVIFDSSLNIASGNLYHSQNLFTVPNSKLMSGFTLSYNSTDSYNGILGTGWTHTYNINLKANTAGDTYTLRNGRGSSTVLYKNEDVYTPDGNSGNSGDSILNY